MQAPPSSRLRRKAGFQRLFSPRARSAKRAGITYGGLYHALYLLPVQLAVCGHTLAAQKLGHTHAQQLRERYEQGSIRQACAGLPLAHGLVGDEEPLRQFLLGPALLSPQLRHKGAEALLVKLKHRPHLVPSLHQGPGPGNR